MQIYDVFVRLSEPSEQLWELALREDSNRALDWLWLATRVDGDKRRYSLQRACEIDPRAASASDAYTS